MVVAPVKRTMLMARLPVAKTRGQHGRAGQPIAKPPNVSVGCAGTLSLGR